MDFELSEEQRIFREAIKSFPENEIGPLVEEAEETDPTDPSQEEIKLMSNMIDKDSDLATEDDLDGIFGIYLSELERRKNEEEENERLGVSTLKSSSVMPYFYEDDE